MTIDADQFETQLRTRLHESLDEIVVNDVPWPVARAAARGRTRARRRVLGSTAAALATAGAVAAVVLAVQPAGRSTKGPTAITAPPQSLRVLATANLDSTTTPARLAAGGGSLFAALWDSGMVVRLDPLSLDRTGSLRVGSSRNGPLSIAYGGGALWVLNFSDGRLWRIDPSTMRPTLKVRLEAQPAQVVFGDGAVWVTVCCGSTHTADRQRLLRLNPDTGAVTGSTVIPGEGETVTVAVGPQVLVASASAPVQVVDPGTMKVVRQLHVGCNGCQGVPGLAVGERSLYVTSFNSVLRFDASSGKFVAESPQLGLDLTATPLALGPDGLWLAAGNEVVRLDVTTLRVTARLQVDSAAQVAVAPPSEYVSGAGTVARVGYVQPSTTDTALSASALCQSALGGRALTAAATTVGEIRTTNIGGPYPGLVPGRHAFPGHAPTEAAAWCWTPSTSASPGTDGGTWDLYGVVRGATPERLFTMGGGARPPVGPPQIP